MKRERFYISTIASDDAAAAEKYGLGLEIAEYCTAYNMDDRFPETHPIVEEKLRGVKNRLLHGPYNELFPCAIDPKARELAKFRYLQAIDLARSYGAKKVIIHAGYNPKIYYRVWYTEQSVPFWQDFVKSIPEDIEVVLENVFEEDPGMLTEIIAHINHPNLKLCLDVGHANAYSGVPLSEWIKAFSPWLSHLHIHNNPGGVDSHQPLYNGTIDMAAALRLTDSLCPDATFTLEVLDAESSVKWLCDNKFI